MGKWLRDIWSEVIAAGVLAVMINLIAIIQNTSPILIAVISFIVILMAFRVTYFFQEKKLKQRLGIERERWNKIREEKIRLRKPYEDRLNITKLLAGMHEQSVLYTQSQLNQKIPKKTWETIAKQTAKVIPKLTIFTMLQTPRFQWLAKQASIRRMISAFLLDMAGVLNSVGLGSLNITNEEKYLTVYNQVKDLETALPAAITQKIEGNILTSNILSSFQIFDLNQPALKKYESELNPQFVNRFQFLLTASHMMLTKSRGDIHSEIEEWLVGGKL